MEMKTMIIDTVRFALSAAAFLLPAGAAVAQQALGNLASTNQNHVQKTVYLEPFTAIPANPTTAQAMRDITYYDGLGRPLQEVGVKASGGTGYRDLVTPIAYDAYGRQEYQYLPYATATGAGGAFKTGSVAQQSSYYSNTGTVPAGQTAHAHAHSRTVFEASPLNRVLGQGAPGAAWQPGTRTATAGRTVAMEYGTNNATAFATVATTRMVSRYGVTLNTDGVPTLTLNGTYAAGELYVTVTKDENWAGGSGTFASRLHTTEEYTDKQGRAVLRRTFNQNGTTSELLSTYYVYNDLGQLAFVLTPEMGPDRTGTTAPTATELDRYAYRYRYDKLGMLAYRRLPGATHWETYNHNPMGWLVFHQDSRQQGEAYDGFTPGQYHTFHKYDGQGRVVMKGVERNRTMTRDAIEGTLATWAAQWEERSTVAGHFHGYTNQSIPQNTANMDVTEVHYYDDYANIPGLPDNQSASYSKLTHGKLVASKVKVLDVAPAVYLWTVYYYDDRGNVVETYAQHYRGGTVSGNYDRTTTTHTFTGKPKLVSRKHFVNNVQQVQVNTDHVYDHRERLVDTWMQVNAGAVPTHISRNHYNEVGQVWKREHNGITGTSLDYPVTYTYNERGWLRTSSSPLFSQELRYNTGSTKYHNGNIAYQVFSRKHTTGATVSDTYTYTYDAVGRLLTGTMAGNRGRETLTYDRNGNIRSLQRTDASGTVVDRLRYDYTDWGNRLRSVHDSVATIEGHYQLPGTTGYTYDANGNVKTRLNTGSTGNNITGTVYNYLNLPWKVSANGTMVTYTYDARGRKLRSVNGINGQTRDYIDGIEYVGGVMELIHMPEGRILRSGSTYTYEYTLRDHLGNTRSAFAGSATGTARFGVDYYPFGLEYLANRSLGSPKNNYLYNGKELQDGLKQYDYGARFYDPVIGRWGSVDPMATTLYEISPYTYVRNNPILRIDRHGLWDITVHAYKDRGKYGYGIAVVTDRHGNEVHTFQVRLEGVGGRDRSKRGADTPLGVYDIPDRNMWISGGNRGSYGPNPRLVLTPESGEIMESGRDLIRIHGGRQEVYDSKTGLWKPVKGSELKKTEGCLRCSDIDIKTLKEITDNLMKNDKEEKGGKLTILDDLQETFVPGPVPFVGGVKYTRPDENASKAEWDTWNQLIRSILGQ